MLRLNAISCLWTCMVVCAIFGGMLVASAPPALAADDASDSVALMRSFVDAWNTGDLDSVVDMFAPDATIEGSGGCCAATGTEQIRPFIEARFGELYQIGWTEPEITGERLAMWSRIAAHNGLNDDVDLTQGGGWEDPEAALIEVVVRVDKISLLHLGASPAARERAVARRIQSETTASKSAPDTLEIGSAQ